jgi:hypothetical protein
MSIVKIKVCEVCESPAVIDKNCTCVWNRNYPVIELEFEQCDHCGHIEEQPIDSEFNDVQRGWTPDDLEQ